MMTYAPDFLIFCDFLDIHWTSTRRAVLYVLWQATQPLKAYSIISALSEAKTVIQATTVYRVLDFFESLGCIHKIEPIHSYMLCRNHVIDHSSEVFCLCVSCHQVSGLLTNEHTMNTIKTIINKTNFNLLNTPTVMKGVCGQCQKN